MIHVHNLEDTICALSTPPGKGGIAVVRVSGPKALAVSRTLCPKLPEKPASHTVHFTPLREPGSEEVVDEVLATFFAHGRSFTGQETVEISCHGSPTVVARLLSLLTQAGARMAERGEFTFRAYMNGKVDLVQAEAIFDLIESDTTAAAKVASRQLRGDLSRKYKEMETGLLWALAQTEAQIDFSTEDIQPVQNDQLVTHLNTLNTLVTSLRDTYSRGRLLKEGLHLVLAGEPNVGKSSLFNAILGEERAIVTEIQGTTRDVLEGRLSWRGYPLVVMDTAGLRDSVDPVERLGIQRAQEAAREADWVLHVVKASDVLSSLDRQMPQLDHPGENVFILVNQIDQLSSSERDAVRDHFEQSGQPLGKAHQVSAKTGEGLPEVLDALVEKMDPRQLAGEEVYINLRHFEALGRIEQRLVSATELLCQEESPELISFELQDAIREVHGLLGKEFYEQVIDQIFAEFCLGK